MSSIPGQGISYNSKASFNMAHLNRPGLTAKYKGGIALAALMLISPLAAHGQSVPAAANGPASPGRVGDQIVQPDLQRGVLPQISVKPVKPQEVPAGAEKITFVLHGIDLTGVTVYHHDELSAVYRDDIGKTVSLAHVYDIANRLTAKYRNDGYILTQVVVPPQTIDKSGNITLNVVEGYVDHVTVGFDDGARNENERALKLIRGYAAKIPQDRALNVKDLERAMLLINDLPGMTARGILSPSNNKVGGADLNILISRKLVDGFVSIDNYGTRYLGPTQYTAAASVNSLFGNNEKLTGQVVAAPGRDLELGYGSLDYLQPLLPNGLKIDFNTNYTRTQPGWILRQFDVQGYANYFGFNVIYPLLRTRATNIYTTGTFDVRDVTTKDDVDVTRRDHIRTVRGDVRIEHLDAIGGAGMNVFDFQLSQGLNILNASDKDDPAKSRADATPTFTKMNIEAQRLQRITQQFNLLLAAKGQYSDDTLFSTEEFGVGGMAYGRGYDPSEILGDKGVSAKAELQWNIPSPLWITHDNQAYTFYDAGKVWNNDTAISNFKTDTLTSAGVGVRSKIGYGTSADLTLGVPLDRDVATRNDRNPTLFFSLGQKF